MCSASCSCCSCSARRWRTGVVAAAVRGSRSDVALTTISGEPLTAKDTFAQVFELVLAAYSVAVFGTLAGALGAFFLSQEGGAGNGHDKDSSPSE